MSKEGLQSLELKWNSDHGDLQGTGVSFHVFEELQPHKHLKKLIIDGYGGPCFPSWVGDDRFSKMRVIELSNCGKCTSLPPLGKLPVLEEVQIRNMGCIECVGEEFYGKERGAFPSLKILKFEGMENWSTWLYPDAGGCGFACLQELHVINCPKLLMSLPDGINVQKLNVIKCDVLLIALPRHSMLEMNIGHCKVELMECLREDGDASKLLPSLSSLNIESVDVVEAHHQMMLLGSLTSLEMASIPKFSHLPGVVLQGLPKLETLRICRCEELKSLWKMDDGEMEIGGLVFLQKQKSHFLNSLRVLDVEECPQLVCLIPQGGEEDDTDRDTDISEEKEEEKRRKQQCLWLPCGLERLRLRKCDKLEKLPTNMHNLTSLRKLEISDCDKLEKLPSDMHNLTSLRSLNIGYCSRLSSLSEMGFPSNLESLYILGCDSLMCLSPSSSMGGNGIPLPHSLKDLIIWGCKNLESLVSSGFTSADSFPSLERVKISGCPKLKCLPVGIHRRLKVLFISDCQNLGELSISSVHHLTALWINGWPAGLLSIQQGGPNPNSLPPNLRTLHITGPSSVTPNGNDEQLFSVPLPSSLTTLWISNFKRLSPEAFQNLTSLEELYISDCPGLTSIPDQLLPPSLLSLQISGCPLLAPHLEKGRGRYWPKVQFIPEVKINYRSIFDPEDVE